VTNEPLCLSEYGHGSFDLADSVARKLARSTRGILEVSPEPDGGQWKITATNYVGTLNAAGLQVLIRPKINLANLLVLLDLGIPATAWQEGDFAYRSRPDLLRAFVAFFARSLEELSAHGLHRSYQREQDRLLALRGRIDFAAQIKKAFLPAPIACVFDEYTADIAENRYLLGVANQLLRLGSIDPNTRAVLLHASSRFEDVTPILPTAADIDRLTLTRLNQHYRPTLQLARLVVENLTISDETGAYTAGSFLLDMNKVFEGYVTRRLRAALRSRLQVCDQTHRCLGVGGKVPIYPDLEFRRHDEVVFVGDVKYKVAPSGKARTDDYFQLLAYCTVLGLSHGVLIYAQVDDGDTAPDHNIEVVTGGQRLTTYRLNLAGTAAGIEASVAQLADWIDRNAN